MRRDLVTSALAILVFTVLFGLVYPLATTGISQVVFSNKADGSQIKRDGKVVTVGGRVLGVTALGGNLDAAVERAYQVVKKISFDGMHYRTDIGQRALARLHAPR